MIIYLVNEKNQRLLDVEIWVKEEDGKRFIELNSVVPIVAYSNFLLENIDRKNEIINTFDELNELRGWLWEVYFLGGQNNPDEYDNVIKELKTIIKKVGKDFNLLIGVD